MISWYSATVRSNVEGAALAKQIGEDDDGEVPWKKILSYCDNCYSERDRNTLVHEEEEEAVSGHQASVEVAQQIQDGTLKGSESCPGVDEDNYSAWEAELEMHRYELA